MGLPLVSSTGGRVTEPSSTYIALVGFGAGMDVTVGLQACVLSEGLAAVDANMWLLSGVELFVAFEISLSLEELIASIAHPLSRHGRDFQ